MLVDIEYSATQDYYFIFLTISLFLLSLLSSSYLKHTKLLLLAVFSQRHANQFLREDNFFTERVNIITLLLMVINFSLLLSKVFERTSITDLSFFIGVVLLYYIVKKLIINIFGKLFMLKNVTNLAVFFSNLFDRVLAILIYVPIVVIFFFSFDIVYEAFLLISVTILLLFLLKSFCLWRLASKNFGFPHFYIFLYLCMVEFFPLLLLGNMILFE